MRGDTSRSAACTKPGISFAGCWPVKTITLAAPAAAALRLRRFDLRRLAADHQHARIRPRLRDDRRRRRSTCRRPDRPRTFRCRAPAARRAQCPTRARISAGDRRRRLVDVAAHHVLDQQRPLARRPSPMTVSCSSWQIVITTSRLVHHLVFGPGEDAPQQRRRLAVFEVAQLLRQARVHVVEMRDAQPLREPHADEAHLFVRVNGVVAIRQHAPERSSTASARRARPW